MQNASYNRPQTSSPRANWRQSKATTTVMPMTPNDFPALVNTVKTTVQSDLGKQGSSLAARLAVAIKNDEEQILVKKQLEHKQREKEKEDNYIHVLPMSQYGRIKYLAEKRFKEEKKREIEMEEHEYQWQISREISREVFENEYAAPAMPHVAHHDDTLHENNEDSEE